MATNLGDMNLIELTQKFSTVEAARAHLEEIRWPQGPFCPHCGVVGNSRRLGGASAARGLFRCRDCRKSFSVTVGTIFQDSHIPLNIWVVGIYLLAASKKGMSAHQFHRMFGITYRSAFHMAHRIRHMMKNGSVEKLDGVVETDETYVGGKAKNVHNGKPVPEKTAVVAMVSRHSGKMRARKVTSVNAQTLSKVLKKHVAKTAEIFTDGAKFYPQATKGLAGHESVNHEAGEYVRGHVSTQSVESFNAILKRGINGIYHHVSKEHLDRYLDEFTFRWDHRNVTDGERARQALSQADGKRLTYRALVEGR